MQYAGSNSFQKHMHIQNILEMWIVCLISVCPDSKSWRIVGLERSVSGCESFRRTEGNVSVHPRVLTADAQGSWNADADVSLRFGLPFCLEKMERAVCFFPQSETQSHHRSLTKPLPYTHSKIIIHFRVCMCNSIPLNADIFH